VEGLGWAPMDPLVLSAEAAQSGGEDTDVSIEPEEETDPYEDLADELDRLEEELAPNTGNRYLPLLWLIPILLITSVIICIFHPSARRYRTLRTTRDGRLRWEFEEIRRILTLLRFAPEDGETLSSYGQRVDPWITMSTPGILAATELLSRLSYTRAKATQADLRVLTDIHRRLIRYSRRVLGLPRYVLWVLLRLERPLERAVKRTEKGNG